ncbi:MAG TPA: fused MFS/spermidine synthase [Lacipirellulaceae bacterium]|nr:fused MFS/spermidine synthase [Lacipirellulaceae bacterium]
MAAKQKTQPRERFAAGDLAATPSAGVPHEHAPAIRALIPGAVGLKLLVFVSGAVLMGLEIVGSRLLAPHFGNSVFVWGSLISLFLIALSAGYYLGGRLADRRPSQALLNSIVAAVAGSLFVIAAVAHAVCEAVVLENFGEKGGPFVASAILFLLPSVGMGIVSPFAVRLATHSVDAVGKTAGTLYALSTFGSIAGTMLTTFVLIPTTGAGTILKGLAAALLAAALATYPFRSRRAAATIVLAGALAAGGAAYGSSPARLHLEPGSTLVLDLDTPDHHISVVDVESVEGDRRELRFDRYVESAISLDPPYTSLSGYTRYFHLAMLPQPAIKRALFIGAGGGIGPRSFHAHDPTMEIEVVDIDQKVLDVARSHFHLEDSPRIKTIAADGRMYVRGAASGAYDCIVLDAFSIGGRIPFHLVSREFFALCRDRLAAGGVFVMNINSAQRGEKGQIFHAMYKTVAAVFPETTHAFVLMRSQISPADSTNVILLGIKSDQRASRADWAAWADRYESASYVGRADLQAMIGDLVATLPDMDDAPLFTDDYAPIETMPF